MVRFFAILVGSLVLTVGAAAQDSPAPGQYDDIKQAFGAVSKAMDTLGTEVDQAQNASDVAQAFTKFAQSMKGFKASMEELQEKYPDMGAHGSAPPADVNDSLAAMQASLEKLPAILKKAEPYATDPAVQDAIQKMKSGE